MKTITACSLLGIWGLTLITVTTRVLGLPQTSQITFDAAASTSQSSSMMPSPSDPTKNETGHGHFSKWSRKTKKEFLKDLSFKPEKTKEWIIVMGNEAGDLDSMVSALAMAYTLGHLKKPIKAVALLQTEQDALYYRPENSLALHHARMASHHRDLLTIDELPIKPQDLWHRIKGISLVDHNVPTSIWGNTTVVSIIDHHADRGFASHASPRIINMTASCSTLVAQWMLDLVDQGKVDIENDHLPHELVELLLRTIAIDSSGLKKSQATDVDVDSAKRLWKRSKWSGHHFGRMNAFLDDDKELDQLKDRMKLLDDELSGAKKNLTSLDVRALLRRDWKGGELPTKSIKYPHLTLGFASAPVGLEEQIDRTPEGTSPEWFAIERAWTAEIGADVSLCLTSYRDSQDRKTHEVVLVVAHGFGKRLHEHAADSLFETLKNAIEQAGVEDLVKWNRPDGKPLLPRRAAYRHWSDDASRKMWRPVIEKAAMNWSPDSDN